VFSLDYKKPLITHAVACLAKSTNVLSISKVRNKEWSKGPCAHVARRLYIG